MEKINVLLNLKNNQINLNKQFKEAEKLYKKKLLDSDIVTKEINDWLKFFGLDKYVIDNKFNLNYANNVINNKMFILSTGEISIITFSYFLKNKNAGIFELYKDNGSLSIRKNTHTKDTIFINYLKSIINIAIDENNNLEIEKVMVYNCIRTVLENFKYLLNLEYSENGDDQTIKEFFELSDDEYSKLDYIINHNSHNSHNEPELSCEPWFDEELLKNYCVIISDMVKKKYSKLHEYCIKEEEIK